MSSRFTPLRCAAPSTATTVSPPRVLKWALARVRVRVRARVRARARARA